MQELESNPFRRQTLLNNAGREIPRIGSGCRNVVLFPLSFGFRIFTARSEFRSGLHLSGGKAIWTKFPRFVDNRRSGNEVTSFVFLFKSLKKIRGAPCLCRVADFHKVKSGPIQGKGFEGCIEKPYFPLSW